MISVSSLFTGFSDAVNYQMREHKHHLNDVLVNKELVESILPSHVSFLVGDKGTGKTAYAVYMANNNIANTHSSLHFIRETEYQKFVHLKKVNQLDLSDYTSIWKVIIYLLMAKKINEKHKNEAGFLKKYTKFNSLIAAIDDFYQNAFSPEIITAISFAEDSKTAAELMNKHIGNVGTQSNTSTQFSEQRYQINLLSLQRQFEGALKTIKLQENHIIFIDGIDLRPHNIPYEEYLDCVKGLANAIWSVNNDFFANIKDSKGRMKAVLLVRPDIFNLFGMQNQNTKIKDNSVLLNWRTTYPGYKKSKLFSLADTLLAKQQKGDSMQLNSGAAWSHYFPYQITDKRNGKIHDSFVSFLRFSLFRPRDIVTMLDIVKRSCIERDPQAVEFSEEDFSSSIFKREYSTYMLGEIRDQISFYHTTEEYEDFLKFFSYLDGKYSFSFNEYTTTYNKFFKEVIEKKIEIPKTFRTSEDFLQFLYELSIICYVQEPEDGEKPFISWCHSDRSPVNISPKVKTGVRYDVHYGLGKALNLGKSFMRNAGR